MYLTDLKPNLSSLSDYQKMLLLSLADGKRVSLSDSAKHALRDYYHDGKFTFKGSMAVAEIRQRRWEAKDGKGQQLRSS
jgi:hypothetical protein